VIFVDAAKGQYMEFFPNCLRLLRKGGLLISDNILYKGMTATDELVVRRKITIVRRLRAYLEMLKENKQLSTAIIPIGDGVAVSVKE
jgi:predicted O-methyltransferase YrrM